MDESGGKEDNTEHSDSEDRNRVSQCRKGDQSEIKSRKEEIGVGGSGQSMAYWEIMFALCKREGHKDTK